MIRSATDDDKISMGRVYCYSWKKGYAGLIPSSYLESLTIENCTPKSINPETNIVFECNNGLVGLVNYGNGRDDSNLGEIRAIYVLPEYWGKGIGEKLFNEASKRLNHAGFTGFYLWVLKANNRAIRFYEKRKMIFANTERKITISNRNLMEVKYCYTFKN